MGYRALPNVHPVTGRSCSRVMERGPAHSQEDAMSKLQTQSQKVQASQLLYRPSDRKTTSGEIIRSKKTAELLCLSRDERSNKINKKTKKQKKKTKSHGKKQITKKKPPKKKKKKKKKKKS